MHPSTCFSRSVDATCDPSAFSKRNSSCSLLDAAAMNSLLFDASSTTCRVEVNQMLLQGCAPLDNQSITVKYPKIWAEGHPNTYLHIYRTPKNSTLNSAFTGSKGEGGWVRIDAISHSCCSVTMVVQSIVARAHLHQHHKRRFVLT